MDGENWVEVVRSGVLLLSKARQQDVVQFRPMFCSRHAGTTASASQDNTEPESHQPQAWIRTARILSKVKYTL